MARCAHGFVWSHRLWFSVRNGFSLSLSTCTTSGIALTRGPLPCGLLRLQLQHSNLIHSSRTTTLTTINSSYSSSSWVLHMRSKVGMHTFLPPGVKVTSKRALSTGSEDSQATAVDGSKVPTTMGGKLLHLLGWLGGFYSRKAVLTRSAILLYEQYIDNVDYEAFFKVCRMPNTFQSWFLVAQLHVWLCLVRLKREGRDGEYVIKQLVQFFWKDVEERMRVLGVHSGKVANLSLQELSKQFKGLVLAYEEGLLSDDRILAAAIWRVFVHEKEHTDPVVLAAMVDYIRAQVKQMDTSDSHSLLRLAKMNAKPLTVKV